jgi:hypothetical protein
MTGVPPFRVAGLGFLIAIDIGLGATLVSEVMSDQLPPIGNTEWAPTMSTAAEDVVIRNPINQYRETLAHPVFFKTRQPYVPPPPTPPAPPPKQVAVPPPIVDPGFIIGGVVINGDVKKAYLSSKANPRGTWVGQGEEIQGWKLESVEHSGARLQQHNRTIVVLLYSKD